MTSHELVAEVEVVVWEMLGHVAKEAVLGAAAAVLASSEASRRQSQEGEASSAECVCLEEEPKRV